jgi:hypothetical protein
MKKKKEVIDLTTSEKIKRKRDLKAASNRKQSEKGKMEREREREANTSQTPGEKKELARG